MLEPMSSRYRRPDWVTRLNSMGDAVGGAERMIALDADDLIGHATQSTGLSHFELTDGAWEERFRNLIDAISASPLHVVGRLMTREELIRSLRTRLFLADALRRDPGITDEQIVSPLIVTGPARSGTTILFELLGLDANLVTPTASRVLHPAPPADAAAEQIIAMSECEQELWADVQPEFDAIHELRSDLPVECITFCSGSFAGNHWAMALQELGGWTPDVEADLAFHRLVLQTVQRRDRTPGDPPKSWLLKTPAHIMILDQILEAYPDARFIQTHRDPARTMPSTVSTTAMVQWLRTDAVDLDSLAPLIAAFFGGALVSVAERRRDGDLPPVFGDVHFVDLLADPVAAVAGAHDAIGRDLTEAHRQAITDYLAAKPRGKHGTHSYTAEEWGFDESAVRAELAPYIDYFNVATES